MQLTKGGAQGPERVDHSVHLTAPRFGARPRDDCALVENDRGVLDEYRIRMVRKSRQSTGIAAERAQHVFVLAMLWDCGGDVDRLGAGVGGLVAVGPLHGEGALTGLVDELEGMGLVYFDDFFELSGNWPDWLQLYAMSR